MGEMGAASRKTSFAVAMTWSRLRIFGLVLVLFAAAGQARAEDVTLLRAREGAAALLRGQYDKAVASYDEALQTPDIADFIKASIYSDRGVAKWRMKQTKETLKHRSKARRRLARDLARTLYQSCIRENFVPSRAKTSDLLALVYLKKRLRPIFRTAQWQLAKRRVGAREQREALRHEQWLKDHEQLSLPSGKGS